MSGDAEDGHEYGRLVDLEGSLTRPDIEFLVERYPASTVFLLDVDGEGTVFRLERVGPEGQKSIRESGSVVDCRLGEEVR